MEIAPLLRHPKQPAGLLSTSRRPLHHSKTIGPIFSPAEPAPRTSHHSNEKVYPKMKAVTGSLIDGKDLVGEALVV